MTMPVPYLASNGESGQSDVLDDLGTLAVQLGVIGTREPTRLEKTVDRIGKQSNFSSIVHNVDPSP